MAYWGVTIKFSSIAIAFSGSLVPSEMAEMMELNNNEILFK